MVVRFSNKHSTGKTGQWIPCNSKGGFNTLLYFGTGNMDTSDRIYLKESEAFYVTNWYDDSISWTCPVKICGGYIKSTEKGSKLVFTQDWSL